MDRFTKISAFMFSLISVIAIFILIFESNEKIIMLATIVIISNMGLMILFILIFNNLIKMSRGFFVSFVVWTIFSTFAYWYIVSMILHYRYGSFLSLNGIYFFIITRSLYRKILMFSGSAVLIILSGLILSHFAREQTHPVIKKKIKKIEKKIVSRVLNFDKKIIKRKFEISGITVLFILFFYLIILFIPTEHIGGASPIVDLVKVFNKDIGKNYTVTDPYMREDIEYKKLIDTKSPNSSVIIIMLESVSRDRMPQYGYNRSITPNIDKFSKDSILFNNTFSTSTHSDYAQPSFLSSRYTLIGNHRNFFDLDYNRTFLWDVLKKENYTTAYISSQDDDWANMVKYYDTQNLDRYSYSITDGEYNYGTGNAKKDYDEVTINKTTTWLENISEPLFLYVNLQATHYPYSYPENNSLFMPDNVSKNTDYFKIAEEDYGNSVNRYDNSLYYVDKQVGVLLDFLKKKDIYNDSIIVLTSDHGETLEPVHGHLRHGFGVYREENMVPMFIKIPGESYKIVNDNVRHLDVIPTVLDILNLSIPREMQGIPMSEDQEIFIFSQNQNFKISLVKDDLKYIIDMNDYTTEAYNLTSDPYEEKNLEIRDSIIFKENRDRLLDWYNCQKSYYTEKNWTNEIICI